MKCGDARHLIHLDAGHDLDSAEEHELAMHLEKCSECRAYHEGMTSAMTALHQLRDFGNSLAASPKMEPALRASSTETLLQRLPVRSPRIHPYRRFNGRVAALAVCSLALAVVTIVQTLPSSDYSSGSSSSAAGLRVAHQSNPGLNGTSAPSPQGNYAPVFGADGRVIGYLRVQPNGSIPQNSSAPDPGEQTF
ncbi:MAG: zf-HC2 domain-containing protein [Planctomyces sp.]|nr:zf-HC2 domain-containing protein [Planctomyces sp.]